MTNKVGLYRDQRNKGKPWVVRWFGEFDPVKGKQRHYSQSFALKREAEAFRAAKQAELDRGGARDVQSDICLEDFVERLFAARLQHQRSSTRGSYRQTLDQLLEFAGAKKPLRKITPEMAERFIASRTRVAAHGEGFSSWSRKRHLTNAKAAFNSAVRWGYLAHNPFEHVQTERCRSKRWHHLSPEEFGKLLGVVDEARWRAFYYLAYTTGARFGELFSLTWADIDLARNEVRIQDRPASKNMPPFQVKDYEARTLLFPEQTSKALLDWQAAAPESVPYVLLTAARWRIVQQKWALCRDGKPWTRNRKTGKMVWAEWENRCMVNNVRRDMKAHVARAGIETDDSLTVHTLRKSFGQNHANAGTPIHVLQRMMGHASITTTREFYLQAADANEREAVARYASILGNSEKTCVRIAYGANSESEEDSPKSTSTA